MLVVYLHPLRSLENMPMTQNPLSTNAAHQREHILAWLLTAPLNIITHWTTVDTGKGEQRIACYVLLSGGENG